MNKKIRSFLYLDNYKMYSFSSQIFEGLTEYIVTNKPDEEFNSESQKGPIGSGRLLADIIQKSNNQSEKRFLHDYSYSLFEESLVNEKKVLELNKDNVEDKIKEIEEYSFVKVTGRVIFNDLKIIEHTLSNFNKIGYALGYVSQKADYEEKLKSLNDQLKKIEDRNQRAKAKNLMKSKTDFIKVLKEQGLQKDEEFLKQLTYVLDYGYNQQFEIQIPLNNDFMFSAQLNREFLKDNENRIIKKYSRETEKEFVLFGVLTQIKSDKDKEDLVMKNYDSDGEEEKGMKEALMIVVKSLIGVENTFTGKLDYEYLVDPIAVYMEL